MLDLNEFGGHLECEVCHRAAPLGDANQRLLGAGWPKCCGYTMRWWTDRQLADRDDPPS